MTGERLRVARKRAGLSLRDLASLVGNQVTPQAIGKYERGEMSPSAVVLTSLALALRTPVDFLQGTSAVKLGELDFRKHSGTSARERNIVEAAVIEQVEKYLFVEEVLGLESTAWKAPFKKRVLNSASDAEEVAVTAREFWKLGVDPIPNLTELLERQGIKVLLLGLPQRVSGLTCFVDRPGVAPIPVIVANRGHTLERRRLTLAHELAHRLIEAGPSADIEKLANRFAGAFLQPAEHLRAELGRDRNGFGVRELLHTKRLYRVSAAALVVRLRDLAIISNETMAYIFQTLGRTWRSTEPEPIESGTLIGMLETPQRYERLCYRALAERLIDKKKAAELLGCSIESLELLMKGEAGQAINTHR